MRKRNTEKLSVILESFFTEHLISERHFSPHTIASYRDTFRLLLQFAKKHLRKLPTALTLSDLQAPFIRKFLYHLEKKRGISARSRNQRLAAIRSFFNYAALYLPQKSRLIQRVLSIPRKRHARPLIPFLTKKEVNALLAAPDRRTWAGRRDHAIILLAVQTGLRVSELRGVRVKDIRIDKVNYVRCFGKGRKERCTPLTKGTRTVLKDWIRSRKLGINDLLFTNARNHEISTDGIQYILDKHVAHAVQKCPSLKRKRVTPHVLRHTAAMELLQAGVDHTIIALWLGHQSPETTQMYVEADLHIKEEALKKTSPDKTSVPRYKPPDHLIEFLNGL